MRLHRGRSRGAPSRVRAGYLASRPACWLVIMVKKPELGRVKTRLGRDIGPGHATRFYRGASHGVVRRLAADPRWRTVLAVAPDHELQTAAFPLEPARIKQGGGDLGDRLARIVCGLPPGPVAIIGTDIPGIQPHHIAGAINAARRNGVAFGPAPDGGYWLVAFRQSPRRLTPFAPVRWSTEHALADTRANLPPELGARIAAAQTLPTLDDVDDGPTYQIVRAWSGRVVLPARSAI